MLFSILYGHLNVHVAGKELIRLLKSSWVKGNSALHISIALNVAKNLQIPPGPSGFDSSRVPKGIPTS